MVWFLGSPIAQAGSLAERVSTFPQWDHKPLMQPASGDLEYPNWLNGNWTVTTTLVDLVAPLAPNLVTPGFNSNRKYLNQPITFQVRFAPQNSLRVSKMRFSVVPFRALVHSPIVADRALNGLNLARAYLGDFVVRSVTVDPQSPNRQVTTLQGNRELVSIVSERAVETLGRDRFLTSELFQQLFRGGPQPYLNQVETTTDYRYQPSEDPEIIADQLTAVYLSPQDPDYFKAGECPVALYRYRMEFRQETEE
jgi:hypothetical protein